jgi:hypothetical protein
MFDTRPLCVSLGVKLEAMIFLMVVEARRQ